MHIRSINGQSGLYVVCASSDLEEEEYESQR